jgi:pteridine reductase
VAPGAVLRPEGWSAERWQAVARLAPLERAGTPEDVAAAVLYLAEAPFVTGQILSVDGGRSLGRAGAEEEDRG